MNYFFGGFSHVLLFEVGSEVDDAIDNMIEPARGITDMHAVI